MKKVNFRYLILSAVFISMHLLSFSQSQFKLDDSTAKLVVSGTSTVHDWEIDVEHFKCDATVSLNEKQGISISGINFTCKAEDVKSHNRIMDNKTFDALKGDKFPQIKFNSSELVLIPTSGSDAKAKGKLTIAGKTNDVTLQFKAVTENQNQMSVKGETHLKLSDFNIDPPTAMMGALKTGDEITITYNVVFQKIEDNNLSEK